MVDNSTSPCERISGWYSFHSPCLIDRFIHSFPTPIGSQLDWSTSAISRSRFSLQWPQKGEEGIGGRG
jgi:hypothetical protein